MQSQPRRLMRRKRYLDRVEAVQKMYMEHKEEGIPDTYILRKYIEPAFFIGYQCMKDYLEVNVGMERKKLKLAFEEAKNQSKDESDRNQ